MGIFNDLQREQERQRQQLADPTPTDASPVASPLTPDRTTERSNERPSERPPVRLTKRYSFELYHDQFMRLKACKHQSELDGQFISLSAMVRQAIDDFLDNH